MVELQICRSCGGPLSGGVCAICTAQEAYREIHKDIVLLVLLSLLAVGLFLAAKAMATSEKRMEERVAGIWYLRGSSQLSSGNVESAIDSFRRAITGDRANRKFTLALANALSTGNHPLEAREALLRLRESDPEDAEINLSLAKLEANSGNLPDAVHFYQNALYGQWTGSHVDERRQQVRLELIHLLLDHNQRSRALSELLILGSEVPQSAGANAEIAKLFLSAGDAQHALGYFENSLRSDPRNADSLAGAGDAAFRLGEYTKALHYLQAAVNQGRNSGPSLELFDLTKTVVSWDPLQPDLSKSERQARLLRGLNQALQRVSSCAGVNVTGEETSQLKSLQSEAEKAKYSIQKSRRPPDSDDPRSELELIYQIEETANRACGNATGLDLGLLLIGRRHLGAQ
jgi:tetratricopeptide (TPR) repeat protein